MDHQSRTMKAAFDGLLNGDTTKRDTLVKDMKRAHFMDAKERALAKLKEIDFFVRPDGESIRLTRLARDALTAELTDAENCPIHRSNRND